MKHFDNLTLTWIDGSQLLIEVWKEYNNYFLLDVFGDEITLTIDGKLYEQPLTIDDYIELYNYSKLILDVSLETNESNFDINLN